MTKELFLFNKNYLAQNEIDAEEVKDEYVNDGGRYDIYNGDTITIELFKELGLSSDVDFV